MRFIELRVQEKRFQPDKFLPHGEDCGCEEAHQTAMRALVSKAKAENRQVTARERATVDKLLVKDPGHYGERTPYEAPLRVIRVLLDDGRHFGDRMLADGTPFVVPLHHAPEDPVHETEVVGPYTDKLPWAEQLEADHIANEKALAEVEAKKEADLAVTTDWKAAADQRHADLEQRVRDLEQKLTAALAAPAPVEAAPA